MRVMDPHTAVALPDDVKGPVFRVGAYDTIEVSVCINAPRWLLVDCEVVATIQLSGNTADPEFTVIALGPDEADRPRQSWFEKVTKDDSDQTRRAWFAEIAKLLHVDKGFLADCRDVAEREGLL